MSRSIGIVRTQTQATEFLFESTRLRRMACSLHGGKACEDLLRKPEEATSKDLDVLG
jgi:hypothetical protein